MGIVILGKNGKFTTCKEQKDPITMWVDLTPELATECLKRNNRNRSLKKSTVIKYTNDIINDNWTEGGDAISFYKNGILGDGQHRCHAVIKANKTIRVLMMFGVSYDAAGGMGCGITRKANDIAKIMLGELPKGSMEMTGFYLQMASNIRGKTSQLQQVEFYQNMEEHVQFILDSYEKHRDGSPVMVGLSVSYIHAALIAALASGDVPKDMIDSFIRVLVSGIATNKQEAIIIKQLRNKIQANSKASIGGAWRPEFFLRTQKVLQNYVVNKPNGVAKGKKMLYFVPKDALPKIHS